MNGGVLSRVSASLTFDDRFLATLNAWTACSLIYPSSAKKGGRPPNMTSRCNFGYMMCRGVYFEPQSSGFGTRMNKGTRAKVSLCYQTVNFADNQIATSARQGEREREREREIETETDRSVAVSAKPVACPRPSCNDPAVYHVFPLTGAKNGQLGTSSDCHP